MRAIEDYDELLVYNIKAETNDDPTHKEQNAREFQGIIVEYPSISTYIEYEGKPYFSIKYTKNGQEFIGYGTYKPEVLSEFLKEYFMPSAQPERKKGRWIAWNGMDIPENHGKHKCSECGEFAPIEYDKPIIRERLTNYCPNCGCRLEEGES